MSAANPQRSTVASGSRLAPAVGLLMSVGLTVVAGCGDSGAPRPGSGDQAGTDPSGRMQSPIGLPADWREAIKRMEAACRAKDLEGALALFDEAPRAALTVLIETARLEIACRQMIDRRFGPREGEPALPASPEEGLLGAKALKVVGEPEHFGEDKVRVNILEERTGPEGTPETARIEMVLVRRKGGWWIVPPGYDGPEAGIIIEGARRKAVALVRMIGELKDGKHGSREEVEKLLGQYAVSGLPAPEGAKPGAPQKAVGR